MTRERILTPETLSSPEAHEEEQWMRSLRPQTLDEYIGQNEIVESLRIAIEAAQKRGEPLDHILFHGPPGLGKTTLAHIIAREMNAELSTSSGPTMERSGDLMGYLTNLQKGDLLFIDEIHRLPRPVEEFLYSAMEDYYVNFPLDKGVYVKPLKFALQPFTLLGATTRAGSLTQPMRERFGISLRLDFYNEKDLTTIVLRSANLLGTPIDEKGAQEIAKRSRGTPRVANRLLKRVRDYAEVRADGNITAEVADQALRLEGVDEKGLDRLDRALLKTIIEYYNGGPVGVQALGATLNEDSETLEDMVEPFLLKIGYVARTPNGRKASRLAYQHLDYPYPEKPDFQLDLPVE